MKLMSIDELESGMILAEDIVGNYGILYASSGTILTDKNINGFRKLNIDYLYVVDDTGDEGGEVYQESVVIIEKNLNKEYGNTVEKFKDVFQNVKSGKKIVLEEIDKSVAPLVEEILKSNNVLGRLRQIEVVDEYTYMHSINVSLISTMIGKWMGYREAEIKKLAMAGLLHDIGKSHIPSGILNKPDKLSYDEFNIMKKHTTMGYDILKSTHNIPESVCLGALQHHERLDGKGYPEKLNARGIHEYAKIIAIADVYDAMTSKRVYKEKISPFKVAELIFEDSFGQLDPEIANTFLNNIFTFYVGNIVKLNNGQIGKVVLLNKARPTRPLIKVSTEYIDLSTNYDVEIIDIIA